MSKHYVDHLLHANQGIRKEIENRLLSDAQRGLATNNYRDYDLVVHKTLNAVINNLDCLIGLETLLKLLCKPRKAPSKAKIYSNILL